MFELMSQQVTSYHHKLKVVFATLHLCVATLCLHIKTCVFLRVQDQQPLDVEAWNFTGNLISSQG